MPVLEPNRPAAELLPLLVVARQASLVEQITQGTHLEQLLLGVYQREWLGHVREARYLPLAGYDQPKIEQALAQLEILRRQAHALSWQQQREQLLAVAALLR
ncbi:hypothetical protein [Hymenobacter pini]|uniref:hypothetical protein n=1 Tax=Hymenobacter pini TaxID=2880879 RepID=UPI001CF1D4C4|nr:hypothetical protein [Hymenobacter pini]MCA8830496.1 hypothetical protein [Hymenobacter pini]